MRAIIACGVIATVVTAGTLAAQTTFRARTTLVLETVMVTDAGGRPVEGLMASDFVVTEDGAPQTLAFCDFQRLSDDLAPPLAVVDDDAPLSGPEPPAPASVAAAGADEARYRNRRLLVFYFDLAGMGQADRLRAFFGADRFVREQMGVADMVAVLTYGGDAVRIVSDFTDDRARLHDAIRELVVGRDRDGDGIADPPEDQGTDFGQNGGELNVFRTDRQLSALQTAVSMLKPLPEQKTLLYFVSGISPNGLDNQAQMTATVNAAIRGNVTINPIDARGLTAEAPLGGANVASPAGLGMLTGAGAAARRDRFAQSQDALYGLAKDTGGRALLDDNDLARGIRRAATSAVSYYVLGYYSTRPDKDGRFRRVTVSVVGHPSVRLAYREGYFGEKEFRKFTGADKERQLEDALMLGDPITDVPMAMAVYYFQINRSEYFVPVSLEIPGRELTFDRDRRQTRTTLDLIGEVKDERGVTVQNVRDKLDIPLTADRAAELLARPIQYETGFTLLPGRYTIKLLARDAVSGRIGTFQSSFTVPNLTRETARVRMSAVVLSSQRVPAGDTLFSVRQRIASDRVNPLISRGERLVPSVTRVFDASRDLEVRFDVYRMDGVANGPLVAFVSLYKDGQPMQDGEPVRAAVTSTVTRFDITVPLTGLAPGDYDCQVTVLDLGQQKAAFWRAPIVVAR